jgi:hypothetical protein
VGNQSRYQSDFRQINLPDAALLPGLFNNAGNYNQVVPFQGFRSIRLAENEANGHYNSLQVDLHANVKNDLSLQFDTPIPRRLTQPAATTMATI